ncbi:hypothetical protein [Winogradskyella psychrotolerans]|uniref:hypothetical protein n=1 Tax=Winogradskyella psychrotolerans TaxID=1344585 RepID=UPI001C069435|nr:hypothetical protein [Winogradskyella psychrotolerans]MBU2927020.1 hypothetical protein [Winogradskyella psychrotolerans]
MKYLLIFSIFLICKLSYGTGQVPDYLVYKGDTLAIFSNPLEKYFELTGQRELMDFVGCGSTACWRGYKAIWELKGDKLYLIQLTSCHNSCGLKIKNADLKKMFGTDIVLADWFTGKIIVPQGERVQYIHMGYASIYGKELHISFKTGIRTSEKTISNEKIANKIRFEKRQREIAIKIQDTLFLQVKKVIIWDTIKTPLYDLCDEKYILTYNKKGNLKKVWVDYESLTHTEKHEEWWWNITDDRKCRRVIKKALKPINISYLDSPKKKIKIPFEIFYRTETGKLELWKEMWMEE